MPRPLQLSYISLIVGLLCLASVFAMMGFYWGILVIFLVGGLWMVSIWYAWQLVEILSLVLVVLGFSIAAVADGSRWLLLWGILALLAAWNLSAFHNKLAVDEEIQDEDQLIRTHLLRLASVLLVGAALPLIAFALQFDLKFWQVFLLGAVLMLGLSQVFSQLRRSAN